MYWARCGDSNPLLPIHSGADNIQKAETTARVFDHCGTVHLYGDDQHGQFDQEDNEFCPAARRRGQGFPLFGSGTNHNLATYFLHIIRKTYLRYFFPAHS